MADNFCQSSTFIDLEPDQIEKAKEIIDKVSEKLEEEVGYLGFTTNIQDSEDHCGIWIYQEDNFNAEHAETLIKALVQELNLQGIVVCSWAYTCSKMRADEFGGGAFAVAKDYDTVWIDAAVEAENQLRENIILG